MWTLGSLSFAAPWALAALLALPALWWLLRITPPTPLRVIFPPLRLLLGLTAREETAAKSPLWLILLRVALALAVIIGLSDPVLNAARGLGGQGPVIVVVDDGWAAARDWSGRQAAMVGLLDQAAREGRPVLLTGTAPTGGPVPDLQVTRAEDARSRALALAPKPWTGDRAATLERLTRAVERTGVPAGEVVWLSDGLREGDTQDWLSGLERFGPVRLVRDEPGRPAVILRPPASERDALRLKALRDSPAGTLDIWVRAHDAEGRLLARQSLRFDDGKSETEAALDLPAEMRNRLTRLDIENQGTAGAVVLLDERWRRRPVGLATGPQRSETQPLLSDFYYVNRALEPFTEVRRGAVADLLGRTLAVLVLADSSPLSDGERQAVTRWIEDGGILLRFAGPRLADDAAIDDPLVPVALRQGGRTLGGAMSWARPARLAPFAAASPFAGLALPGDVTVARQVLASPALDLADKTWATLADGTPLVTAERRGKGWLTLVHTSSNTSWSNLALSGLFLEMLRRIVDLSHGAVAQPGGPPLPPLESLDGFGRLGTPPTGALGLAADGFENALPGPEHPPGYYGQADARRALNLSASLPAPRALAAAPAGVGDETYGRDRQVAFQPWLLAAALLLALIDLAASLMLRGLLRGRPRAAAAVVAMVALFAAAAPPAARAQSMEGLGGEAFAEEASRSTRLAYVMTGDDRLDAVSRAGLIGLSVIAGRRTAVELEAPVGVDLERDEIVFFPLLYWPVTESVAPSVEAAVKLRAFMDGGGVILFDTRDPDGAVSITALRRLADSLRLPPLIPAPADHVLSRAYYLLRDYPGRWAGGTVWVERAGERVNDGVSPVIVGSNDWAAAWAMDPEQRPLYPAVPGGERQRELAFRFGINLLMYALTGNYKADQVHVPAIMERLGL